MVPGICSCETGEFDPFFGNPQLPGVSAWAGWMQESIWDYRWGLSSSTGGLASGLRCQEVLLWQLQLEIIPPCCSLFSSLALLKGHDQWNRFLSNIIGNCWLTGKQVKNFIHSPSGWKSSSSSVIYHLCTVIWRDFWGSQDACFVQTGQFFNEGDHLSACPGTVRHIGRDKTCVFALLREYNSCGFSDTLCPNNLHNERKWKKQSCHSDQIFVV